MTTQPGRPVRLLSCHRPSFASFRQAHFRVGVSDGRGFPSSLTHSSFHFVGDSIFWGQFGYRKLLYYKGFPDMSTPVFSVSVCSSVKIKGRDCGTINGHEESLSIRTLMKDAREILVRLTDTYILYNSQICLTESNPLSSTSCS